MIAGTTKCKRLLRWSGLKVEELVMTLDARARLQEFDTGFEGDARSRAQMEFLE